MKYWFICFLLLPLSAAELDPQQVSVNESSFKDYWYQGKAEITRFKLKQARYGAIHNGDAVLIFVTEPFLAENQVKHEYGAGENYPVLKLNFDKKFTTGIYPYSIMSSVFSRIDFQKRFTPKVTFSSQEWCGHVYAQLNRRDTDYQLRGHSYFQNEGDVNRSLPLVMLEDEVWTMIRLTPNKLPTGRFQMLPGLEYSRLRHVKPQAREVEAFLNRLKDDTFAQERLFAYIIKYPDLDRELAIFFQQTAPYRIMGWRERVGELETVAVRTHEILSPYWSHNRPADLKLREQLGLEPK